MRRATDLAVRMARYWAAVAARLSAEDRGMLSAETRELERLAADYGVAEDGIRARLEFEQARAAKQTGGTGT